MPELKHAELIRGVVHLHPSVPLELGVARSTLAGWLSFYQLSAPGVEGACSATWLMSEDSVPQPDVSLRIQPASGGQSGNRGAYYSGAPELIIEVSQTTLTQDQGEKLRLHQRSGVREYLIVRPQRRELERRFLTRRKYALLAPGADGWYRSRVFPGLWLDPSALWEGDVARIAATVQLGVASKEHVTFARRLQDHSR